MTVPHVIPTDRPYCGGRCRAATFDPDVAAFAHQTGTSYIDVLWFATLFADLDAAALEEKRPDGLRLGRDEYGNEVTAIIDRPGDDPFVIYSEPVHRPTVDWILSLADRGRAGHGG